MGRGLTRSRSTPAAKRKRTLSRAGTLVDYEDAFEEEEPRHESVDDEEVLEKYRHASNIATEVLQEVVLGVQVGTSSSTLCQAGDRLILEKTKTLFTHTKDEEGEPVRCGIAFPVCVSIGQEVCHCSPVRPEDDRIIQTGDVVHVELGVHVDGYMATGAHTVVAGLEDDTNVEECEEDIKTKVSVLAATYTAGQAALRLMKPGHTNHEVTEAILNVTRSLGVYPCQGVLSHRLSRYEEQGSQVILGCKVVDDSHQLVETVNFHENQVWTLDLVVINSEETRLRERELNRTTVYKRSEVLTNMRVKAAGAVLTELRDRGRAAILPFSYGTLQNPVRSRFGINILQHANLMDPFPVLACKPPHIVARYKWTVAIMPKAVQKWVVLPPPPYVRITTGNLLPDMKALMAEGLHLVPSKRSRSAQARKRRKVEGKEGGGGTGAAAMAE